MKKLKNLKARLLSLSLAFAMVLSLAMGMAPMNVYAEGENPTPATSTLTYNIVGGSGNMDTATLTVGESFTLPNPSFTAGEGRKFYGWIVTDNTESGRVETSGFSNVSINAKEGKTYTATAYYGFDITLNGLPDGTTTMHGSVMCRNPEALVVPEFTESQMEGNAFMIMNESITSELSFTVQNATINCVQQDAESGSYMYAVTNITGPVTVNFNVSEPTPPAGDSITITLNRENFSGDLYYCINEAPSFSLVEGNTISITANDFLSFATFDVEHKVTASDNGVTITKLPDNAGACIYKVSGFRGPTTLTINPVASGENPPAGEPEQNNKIKDLVDIVQHDTDTNTFTVTLNPSKRYVISNMPFEFYNNNGNGMSAATFNQNMGDVDEKVARAKTANSLESFEGVTNIYELDQALAIVKVYDEINLNTLVTGQSRATVSLPKGGVFIVHEIKDGEGTELRDSSDGLSGTYYITAGIHGKFIPAVETSGGGEGSEFNVIDKIDININREFLADLAEGTYNEGKFSPFELGNGSKEGNANIYEFVGNEVALYCGSSRVNNGEPVDLENETYYVVDIIKISDQESRHRFANVMTALSGDDKFTFDLLMASNNDNPIQYNFFATVTYEIAPGGEQGGGSNPPTPTPGNGSNGGSSSSSSSSSTSSTSTPSTSTPSTAPITVPVSNGGNDNVLNINASLSGEKATVSELTADEINKVAKNETEKSIEINLSETGKKVKEAALPVSSLNEIARIMDDPSNKLDNVTIKLSNATVEVSEHALKAVLSKTTGNDLRLVVDDIHKDTLNNTQKESVKNQNVHQCIDAYFISNGVRIGDFQGGTATIRLPFNVPEGLNGNGFSVWYVGDDGRIEKHDTQYVNGELVFTVSHFSDYVVVYDGAVKDNVPKTGEAADYTTLVWTSILAIGVLGLVLNRQKRRQ